jgi:hypothetical protein
MILKNSIGKLNQKYIEMGLNLKKELRSGN